MSKKKPTWSDVKKGDELDFDGRTWRVVKHKPKGKKARVMLEYRGRYIEDTVKLADRVTYAKGSKKSKLTGSDGEQTRWATKGEAKKAGVGLAAGNPERTEPPAPPAGDVWDRPSDRVEKMLDRLLTARLVAETKDEAEGYYVPPVGVDTVASHLVNFHGGIPSACEDEGAMLRAHEAQHAAAKKGEGILAVNHWHTEKRP